jgi:hypothetical protein
MGVGECAVIDSGMLLLSATRRLSAPCTQHWLPMTLPVFAVPLAWNHDQDTSLTHSLSFASDRTQLVPDLSGGGVLHSMQYLNRSNFVACIVRGVPVREMVRASLAVK